MTVDAAASRGRLIGAAIAAVVVGVVVWFVVATAANFVERWTVAGYAESEPAMTFTLVMMIGRLATGIVASLAAGAVAQAIAGPLAVRVLAVVMVVLFVPVHVSLWDRFPIWYHAFFLLSLAPSVWLGGRAVAGRATTARA